MGYAATGRRIGNLIVRNLGIIGPFLLARCSIYGKQAVTRRAKIKGITDLERRGFRPPAFFRQVACAEHPCPFQLANIVAGDLGQRRIALRTLRTAPCGPVTIDLQHSRITDHILTGCRYGVGNACPIGKSDNHTAKDTNHGEGCKTAQHSHNAALALQSAQRKNDWHQQYQRCNHTWHQRPAVQADLPDRPCHCADHNQHIQPRARYISHEQ